MNEPLNPKLGAAGVSGSQEAMALFLASCAVTRPDNYVENTYLDALAAALSLPPEMKADIKAQARPAADNRPDRLEPAQAPGFSAGGLLLASVSLWKKLYKIFFLGDN